MSLSVAGLTKSFAGRRVLHGLSLTVAPGEVVGLLGPNGAGKTTAFRLVAGLANADSGSVRLQDSPLDGLPLWARVQRGLGYLPQDGSLLNSLTVLDNLMLPARARGVPSTEARQRAEALLASDGLVALGEARAATLSGGERRRVELLRCLAATPSVLLLDEPFAGVDPVAVDSLQDRIRRLAAGGLGVLITDHAVHATLPLCDRALVLDGGSVIAEGTASAVASNAKVQARYLGPRFVFPTGSP